MSRLSFIQAKRLTIQQAIQQAEMCRLKGKKIVFTNGCFDILHLGHVSYLAQAADLGQVLFVGINDDHSVRGLEKGADRPINSEDARATVLSALGMVDHVIVFTEPTPLALIEAIKPDVLVKGADYDATTDDPRNPRYIVGKKEVESWGGIVNTIQMVEGYSTTAILNKR